MFPFKWCLILGIGLSPLFAGAQSLRKQTIRRAWLERPHFKLALALETWQETMDLKSGGHEADMRTQSDGISIIGKWVRSKGRLQRFYGGEFAFGRVKGKGSTSSVPDELNDQSWFLFGGVGGYTYRTSLVSGLGVSLSALYRRINWKLESGTDLRIESRPFSLGIGGQYIIMLSRTSSVVIAATHQYLWDSTVWSIGYQSNFF
jgi:hypothetical protein